ncbi:AAA domain-containing protein [Dyadobacter sandarakinus]|uniref:DUF4011 domain-containing protein n=1 Tax=Dyadobacter sandarakinus TaxID=2747268 RepID=A0ABX7ICX7_9BACT|nr:AAA domain-containing protein [Dyadobacter sandarakinus]QRR03382.1 DUF4011 domain-containing protein [Dyadobacter sandarakinus]
MERVLKAYLKRLTNLSTRNKSLLLGHLSAEQFLDLQETDFLLGKPSVEIVRQMVQRKAKVPLCDVQDPRYEKVNDVSKRLRKIARTERFIEEERGSRDLYVGYPFVKGKLADGTPIHAPLLFFPVTLRIEKEQWCLLEREDSGIMLNQSFALAYAYFNEAQISEEVLEKSFEDFPKDFLEFKTQLYEWLKETAFRINFNQALFEEKLDAFKASRSAEMQVSEKNGELKLQPEAVLGIFPQAGSHLVPDYNWLLENLDSVTGIPLLAGTEPEDTSGANTAAQPVQTREEDLLTPFSIDESQEEIIQAVKGGNSVVVQGPPGSGKSQLICNLMADFASRGKRVLLVCQKRAALDVVYQRLDSIGMRHFVGLVHDVKNDRSQLYQQLAAQIERVEEYRKQNYSLDAVFLEREFAKESRTIDKVVGDLNAFRKALFDENECGTSIKELYLTSSPAAPYISLRDEYRSFRPDRLDDFSRRLKTYLRYCVHVHPRHAWASRRSFAAFGIQDLRNMENMLTEWPQVFEKQRTRFENAAGTVFKMEYLSNRAEVLERLRDIEELVAEPAVYALFKNYVNTPRENPARLALIRQTTDELEGFISEHGIELSLQKGELAAFRGILKKTMDAKSSMVSGLIWNVFSKEKKEVEEVCQANHLTLAPEDLQTLEVRLKNRQQVESWLENPLLGYHENASGDGISAEAYLAFFRHVEFAADAASRAAFEPWLQVLISLAQESMDIFRQRLGMLIAWAEGWEKFETIMLPYLLPAQIGQLVSEPAAYSQLLLDALRTDFDSIADMDRLWNEMNPTEQSVVQKVQGESTKRGLVDVDVQLSLFENSVRLAWIEHIETRYPDLRAVTSLKMKQWEEQLQESISAKQKLSSDITGIKLKEATYEDLEKNRLGNRITYRELGHQVTKKRKIWPVRKLVENYTEEVFSLVPCWMASPESVSAIFPLKEGIFDLVIFDEASQCYAEYGLPAAFRGMQIVVAGDSKQLAPSDIYRVRFEEKTDEDDYQPAMEVESLLDLAGQSLAQYQLTGHYRSLSLDLIDFSNRHFYKNSLKLLPDFHRINERQPGIQYLKTEGSWKSSTNAAEVEKVVEVLRTLSGLGKSVGVVTFNFYQQQAIQEALEKEALVVKDLFVKNIENVQGDERDIIIFSTAYAPDEKGRISMQFGSLNMQGGENRLNVAVTRARERIFFVTSLWPSQLQTEHTANPGPKMLKAYLEYAWEVSEGKYEPRPMHAGTLRSDWLLKNKLEGRQPTWQKELPFGDLTIKEGEAYKGLILTDDDLYFHSKSAKEPHAYLPLLLRQKNWPFRRVYSREYWASQLDISL